MPAVYGIFCICVAAAVLHILKTMREKRRTVAMMALDDYALLRDKISGQMGDSSIGLSEWMEYRKIAESVDQNVRTCARISLPSLQESVEKIMAGKQARPAP